MATGTPVLVLDTGGETKLRSVKMTWTSTAGGAVITDAIRILSGAFVGIRTKPGATTPTSYNIQVRLGATTAFADLLGGSGAGRSTTTEEMAYPLSTSGGDVAVPLRNQDVYVHIDTAGAAKTGEFELFFKEIAS